RQGLGETVSTHRPDQRLGLHQSPHALLEKERVPFGALDQRLLERLQVGGVAKKRVEKFIGVLGHERIEAELSVIAFASPPVLVLGTVVDEQQDSCGGDAVYQIVEERLCLRVDPLVILEDYDWWWHMVFCVMRESYC